MLPRWLVLAGLLLACAGAFHDHRLASASADTDGPHRTPPPSVFVKELPTGRYEFPLVVNSLNSKINFSVFKYSSHLPANSHSLIETQNVSPFIVKSSLHNQPDIESGKDPFYTNIFNVTPHERDEQNLKFAESQSTNPHHELEDHNVQSAFSNRNLLPFYSLTIPQTVLQYLISIKRENRRKSNVSNYFDSQEIPATTNFVLSPPKNVFSFFPLKAFTNTTELPSDRVTSYSDQFKTEIPTVDYGVQKFNSAVNSTAEGKNIDFFISSHSELFSNPPRLLPASSVDVAHQIIASDSFTNDSSTSGNDGLPISGEEKSMKTAISLAKDTGKYINTIGTPEMTAERTAQNTDIIKEYGIKTLGLHGIKDLTPFFNGLRRQGSKFKNMSNHSVKNRHAVTSSSITGVTEVSPSVALDLSSLSDEDKMFLGSDMTQAGPSGTFHSPVTDEVLSHPNAVQEDVFENTESSVVNHENSPKFSPLAGTPKWSVSLELSNVQSKRTTFTNVSNKSSASVLEIERLKSRRQFKTSQGATHPPPVERTTRRQRRTMYVVVVEDRPCAGVCCKRELYTGRCRLSLQCALVRFQFSAVRKLACGTNFQATLGATPFLEPPPTQQPISTTVRWSLEPENPDNRSFTDSSIRRSAHTSRSTNSSSKNFLNDNSSYIPRTEHASSINSSVIFDVSSRAPDTLSTGVPSEIGMSKSFSGNPVSGSSLINSSSSFDFAGTSVTEVLGDGHFITSSSTSGTVNAPSTSVDHKSESVPLNTTSILINDAMTVTYLNDSAQPAMEAPIMNSDPSTIHNLYSDNKTYDVFETPGYQNMNETATSTSIPYSTEHFNAQNNSTHLNDTSEPLNETLHITQGFSEEDVTISSTNDTEAPFKFQENEAEKETSNETEAGEWDAYITDELSIDYNYDDYTTDPEYGYYYYDEPATKHVVHTDELWISHADAPGPLALSEIESVALGRNHGRVEEADAEWINEDNRRGPHLVMSSHKLK